jgi:hypothetical protein
MNKLKQTAMALMLCLLTAAAYGQKDSVYVIKTIDEMTNETFLYANRGFVVANETSTKGFKVSPFIETDYTMSGIIVTIVGIGNCNENNEMIILFENGDKLTKKSWNKFNCEGEAYFDFSDKELILLKSQPISKIRITNGRSYESFTGDVKNADKNYFIKLFYALDNKITGK